jgi:hypothetical protein
MLGQPQSRSVDFILKFFAFAICRFAKCKLFQQDLCRRGSLDRPKGPAAEAALAAFRGDYGQTSQAEYALEIAV